MKDIFKSESDTKTVVNLFDDKKKLKGRLSFSNCSLRNFYTFLDLHVRNNLNLIPVIAVDFSLANLTFDESCYCLHSLKPGQPNDYIEGLKRIHRSFNKFSDYMLAYGFGARTVAGDGPACNAFSMTGDFVDPFIENEDQLINSYGGTLKGVKLALPV